MVSKRVGKWSRLIGTVALTAAVTVIGLKWVGADFSPLSGDASYQKFVSAYELLSQSYVQKVSTPQLLEGAIGGMVQSVGDPFSVYMNPGMTARFRELVTSHFQGIGAVLSLQSGNMVISTVMPGSPAQKAGLAPGDMLLKIGGTSTTGLSLEQAVEKIRGQRGTYVTLEIRRGDQELTMKVMRARLDQATVYARMLPDQIGYLRITQFSEDTASAFARDLDILTKSGARALIIDVRDDPGGLLQSVAQISDDLLPKSKVIVQLQDRAGKREVIRSTGGSVHVPMVCLINGDSASAAEILAAALEESGNVPLIGERTYGKGTVQETREFKDGSSIKLTVAKWLTPDGQWIHKHGIAPTVAVPTPSYFRLPPLAMTMATPYTLNANNVEVAVLQRMLLALGFNPGRTDGYYSQETKNAVAVFQRQQKLPVNGELNDATAYAVNVAILRLKQRDDPQLTAAIGYLEQKLMK
ncbi:MAG: S41 family peptidase [Acidibacillus sp.]|uniref:Carboxy-terminal processing protease CtpB n=1 Tax=Sulfoacidibacillus ferrooxidans TaxID=2005001 RepID=A0A9X2ACU9_9BACL|nr:S41 family peptidase [Sulfoacidibacillus ferrooxidans]MCI0182725.1 Carboxy-terminal processing protease CtpB [Sulfoacidibacillus ferrooxidans]MCY0892514.1 S41 family peptidase [Acidibacillus sp.]